MTEEIRQILLLLSQQESLGLVSLATTLAVALGCGLAIYLLYKYGSSGFSVGNPCQELAG